MANMSKKKKTLYHWPFQDPVREYPHKIWPYMVQYLQFRILEFPLTLLIFHSLQDEDMHILVKGAFAVDPPTDNVRQGLGYVFKAFFGNQFWQFWPIDCHRFRVHFKGFCLWLSPFQSRSISCYSLLPERRLRASRKEKDWAPAGQWSGRSDISQGRLLRQDRSSMVWVLGGQRIWTATPGL